MCQTTERTSLQLPTAFTSPAAARAFVRSNSCPEHAPPFLGDAQLLISELVTNAVLYGEPPVTITLDCEAGRFQAAVRDAAPAMPEPHQATADDEGGRGLALVDHLSGAWGVELVCDEHGKGKVVWFELRPSGATAECAERHEVHARGRGFRSGRDVHVPLGAHGSSSHG